MVANFLSHSDLFAAGIARSGPYPTEAPYPIGFQTKKRNYWEAPEVYNVCLLLWTPIKIENTTPLLVHGSRQITPVRYPMQASVIFIRLKGQVQTAQTSDDFHKESMAIRLKKVFYICFWGRNC